MRNPSSSSSASPSAAAKVSAGSKTPCCSKVGLKRGPWTPEEDELLASYIRREGEGRWRTLPKRAGLLRCGKSCRLRWMNYLRPSVKRGQIAPDEEDLILRLHRLLGNRWSLIAGRIPGRTDNEIKNYWNTHLSKKLISQGIDPRTHKPLNPESSGDAKASSSKPSRAPPPNPHTSASSPEETASATKQSHHYYDAANFETTPHPYITDASGMGLRNHHALSNEDMDEDINYCAEDTFSSFLNSLINEDVFTGHQHPTGIAPASASASDPFISSAQSFGFGAGWESAIMSSSFNQNDPKTLNDRTE